MLGLEPEQFGQKVIDAHAGRGRNRQLARIPARIVDELRHRRDREIRAYQQHVGRKRKRTDRRKDLVPLIRRLWHGHWAQDDRPVRSHENGVPVRLCARDEFAGDQPSRAGLVVDNDTLSESVADCGLQDARADVDVSTCRVRYDEDDRPGRNLRQRAPGERQKDESRC